MPAEIRGAIADRYAAALLELAEEKGMLDPVAGDLRNMRAMVAASSELRRLLASPIVGRVAQKRVVAALAQSAGFTVITANFLGVIAHNRRLFALTGIISAFLATLAAKRGEVTAHIASAAPLAEAQIQAVAAALRKVVGRNVTLETAVDASLLGGLVVQVGSRMIDGSIKTKLQRLSLAMKGIG